MTNAIEKINIKDYHIQNEHTRIQTEVEESKGHDKGREKQEKAGDHQDKENKRKHEKDKIQN